MAGELCHLFMKGKMFMNKKTVKDIDLKDKKVLVRCDFNVPMDENKNITDNRRIVAALPTIKYSLSLLSNLTDSLYPYFFT